jgi:hypothetical protein
LSQPECSGGTLGIEIILLVRIKEVSEPQKNGYRSGGKGQCNLPPYGLTPHAFQADRKIPDQIHFIFANRNALFDMRVELGNFQMTDIIPVRILCSFYSREFDQL